MHNKSSHSLRTLYYYGERQSRPQSSSAISKETSGGDVTCQACRGNSSSVSSKPPLLTRVARSGPRTRLEEHVRTYIRSQIMQGCACACKTAVLKDRFSNQFFRISQSNGKNANPKTDIVEIHFQISRTIHCRSEMRILKSKSRFPNRTHPKNKRAFFLRSFVLVVCLFVCLYFVFSL